MSTSKPERGGRADGERRDRTEHEGERSGVREAEIAAAAERYKVDAQKEIASLQAESARRVSRLELLVKVLVVLIPIGGVGGSLLGALVPHKPDVPAVTAPVSPTCRKYLERLETLARAKETTCEGLRSTSQRAVEACGQ
jgi:hypothetical protein